MILTIILPSAETITQPFDCPIVNDETTRGCTRMHEDYVIIAQVIIADD